MKYPWIDQYLMQKKGVTKDLQKDWNWVRYLIGGKMFCAICMSWENEPYYITLKLTPSNGDALRRMYPDILPGYYMNKVHWNSVKPDGDVPDELLREMLDEAYNLVFSGLTKKMQTQIMNSQEDK